MQEPPFLRHEPQVPLLQVPLLQMPLQHWVPQDVVPDGQGAHALLTQLALQHSLPAVQEPPFEMQHSSSSFEHTCPSGQQVALMPVPHTCASGQHVPSTQVAPVWQHWVPQGSVPAGHWAHVPLTQMPLRHGVPPGLQVPPFGM